MKVETNAVKLQTQVKKESEAVKVKKEVVEKKEDVKVKNKKNDQYKEERLKKAVEMAMNEVLGEERELHFSIHEKTNDIMVKVVEVESQEVVREIPSKKILDMVAHMMELAGLIVDEEI